MSVPYTFASATTSLPLSQLDSNFSYFADAITVSSGNVGIGTTSNPSGFRLYVDDQGVSSVGTAGEETCILAGSGSGFIGTWSTHPLNIGANGSNHISVTTTGNVGIGTTSPSYQLQLSTDSAAKPSTNTWTIASDARIKKVTGEYTKGLDAVCALRPITYEYNGAAGFEVDGKENISIIAQEAIEHFPECVGTFNAKLNATDEIETELYNWNGHALTFALVNAIKELKAELNTVKSELNALKNA